MTIRIRTAFRAHRVEPMVGILIRNRIGMEIYGTNTRIEQVDLGAFEAGEELDIDFQLRMLADAAAIHGNRGHPVSRRIEP